MAGEMMAEQETEETVTEMRADRPYSDWTAAALLDVVRKSDLDQDVYEEVRRRLLDRDLIRGRDAEKFMPYDVYPLIGQTNNTDRPKCTDKWIAPKPYWSEHQCRYLERVVASMEEWVNGQA